MAAIQQEPSAAPTTANAPADAVVDPHAKSTDDGTRNGSQADEKTRSESALFTPLSISNGRIELAHRIIMAPMTRNRGVPLYLTRPNRAWAHDELGALYYGQRATPGGLIITEGIYPTVEASASPCVPGLFDDKQVPGWTAVVNAVHGKGGYIFAQLWHAGRTCLPHFTGKPAMSSSSTPLDGDQEARYPPPDDDSGSPGTGQRVKLRDFPPQEMTYSDIKRTIDAYVSTAKRAMDQCGFDGIEIHGGNGYLLEQFLSTNVNKRTDEYGGTIEGYCRFPVELMTALADAIGGENVAIRLSPFGLFNQSYGEQRPEIWSYLCRALKQKISNMSYIHFIEPRFEQIIDTTSKDSYLKSLGGNISIKPFQEIMGSTPFVVSGGYNDTNIWGVIESGNADAISIGRYFTSNPDLVARLREGKELRKYDRDRFYWIDEPRERGYTDFEPFS
ncbi:12-oxophytodienoate 3 [Cyphellophora attinorum]|uniref:12-oxophytodienoate 3 n=1 Tax=Cyphellophora attinorum TaxID=1664694 RepID=A0A0N1NZW2_9EURO|nr:12-oxophytodienoate 3 [Phialophora attinorum]KPI38265.1 12-oxophytodienoate 3 [Phialophora attinorum]